SSGWVVPGTYTYAEAPDAQWTQTSDSCSGSVTLAAGDNVTCTVVNTHKARLTVTKQTVGGNASSGFTCAVAGSTGNGGSLGAGASLSSGWVVPGTYTYGEAAQANWTQVSDSCSGSVSLAAGDDKACTVVNQAWGKLVITKNAIGATSSSQFSFVVAGPSTS